MPQCALWWLWSNLVTQAQAHGVAVNSTPAVGSIAWWGANSNGSGPSGHVAYVEEVGPGYIVVSAVTTPPASSMSSTRQPDTPPG
ncbi:CHAP domain-containing protein [Kibdelosporangium lantanae]|uniref:CHAP domain-containing protein n=1 Tax=Kibdelosporangium lantanae TaxID=1497396 RepID=A0ABW3MG76_9PSEU